MLEPFKPYFNNSLGIWIESREQLMKLEKNGIEFLNIDDYERTKKKIKTEIQEKKTKTLQDKVNSKINDLKWGKSFYKNKF